MKREYSCYSLGNTFEAKFGTNPFICIVDVLNLRTFKTPIFILYIIMDILPKDIIYYEENYTY